MATQVPHIDYRSPADALSQILSWLEENIDLDHLRAVEQRHIRALAFEPLDHPPLTFSAPVPAPWAIYPYRETFEDPVKMLINELIGPYAAIGPSPSIVNSVLIKDDYPLQIRAFYGVGLFVSLFGVASEISGENFPWVRPVGLDALKALATHGVPEIGGGLFGRALETMAYYKEALAPYPKCRQAIHITQPDLQGVFENAAHLWRGDIFAAFYNCPDFLRELLDFLAETWIQACQVAAAASTETADEDHIYLHFGIFKGRCLLKDDSCVMLSPRIYRAFIRPVNEKVLAALGGGGIHWCGNGDQWRTEVLRTRDLLCLDFGQPYMLDLADWAKRLRACGISVGRMEWPIARWQAAQPQHLFPTGGGFTVLLDDFAQVNGVRQALAS